MPPPNITIKIKWPTGKGTRITATLLIFGLLWTLTSVQCQSTHSHHAKLGVLVDLHEPGSSSSGGHGKNVSSIPVPCGPLNVHSYQKLKAIEWAVELINNKSWPGEFSLDILVHDTCGESGMASSETARLLKWSKDNLETPLIGVIVIGSLNNERIIDSPLENLNNENISAIVTSARASDLVLSNHSNVFTTAPDLSSVTEGIVALINQLGASNVAIISSSWQAIKKFQRLSTPLSINSKNALLIQKYKLPSLKDIATFLEGQEASKVQSVVMLLESTELENLIGDGDVLVVEKFQKLVGQKSWILGSVGMDNELVQDWSSKFKVNLLVMQPRASINSDFHAYFVDKLMASMSSGNEDKEAIQYVEATYHCQDSKSNKSRKSRRLNNPLIPECRDLSRSTFLKKLHPESDIGFIINAVSAFSAALRLAQLSSCSNPNDTDTNCNSSSNLSTQVLGALRSLNIPAKDVEDQDLGSGAQPTDPTVSSSHEIEGTQRRINFHGKLISRKYDLLLCRANGKLSKIGQYSHEDGLVLDVMVGVKLEGGTSMQDVAEKGSSSSTTKKMSMRKGKTAKDQKSTQEYLREDGKSEGSDGVNVQRMMSPPELYISRMWAMVATAAAITGVFIAMYMLVYVLQRMCDGTLRGNQILGILLLLGIIMMYASVVLFVLPPGTLLCNFKIFLPSLATATCFGILMLKAMQLRSLVSLGLGGRVPAFNQFMTLVFIVAVQAAVNIQWFLGPHDRMSNNNGLTMEYMSFSPTKQPLFQDCFYSHHSFLYLHSYLGILILVVFLYGLSVLKIRRNYNEAKWITLASCLSLPIAVAWSIIVHVAPQNFQEPAACAAFITTATVLLFSIFIPKLNTISQQSKVGKRKLQQGHGNSQQNTLKSGGGGPGQPGYNGGSISTIFTNVSDRGTLQSQISQKRGSPQMQHKKHNNNRHSQQQPQPPTYATSANMNHHNLYHGQGPPPLISSSHGGKSVTYSPRLTTNFYHSSSTGTSLARSASMKTPFFDSGRAAYP